MALNTILIMPPPEPVHVVRIAAFGEPVLYHPDLLPSPRKTAHRGRFHVVHPIADLHSVLTRADAVLLTTPHTPRTDNLFDAAAFAALDVSVGAKDRPVHDATMNLDDTLKTNRTSSNSTRAKVPTPGSPGATL